MTTQNSSGNKPAVDKTNARTETAESPGAGDISLEDLGLPTRVRSILHEAELDTAQDILDVLAQGEDKLLAISGVGQKTLEKVQQHLEKKGLPSTQEKVLERAREASVEAEPVMPATKASATTTEMEEEPETLVENETMEMPAPSVEDEGVEQRVSFIVRLTVDERGEPRRTEIEHAQSRKKDSFSGLDVERLSAFMQECISPPVVEEPSIPSGPLAISEVRVFRPDFPDRAVMVLNPNEAFVIQADFQIRSSEAESLATQEAAVEMKVYAHEVTSGQSTLLTQLRHDLLENVWRYTPEAEVSGLPAGLYRLVTLVTVPGPLNIAGYHEGPILRVVEVQPSTEAAPVSHRNLHL